MQSCHLAILDCQLLRERLADAEGDASLDLPLVGDRVEYRTDVVGADEVQYRHGAGLRVDLDFGSLRVERGTAIQRLRYIAADPAHRHLLRLSRLCGQLS